MRPDSSLLSFLFSQTIFMACYLGTLSFPEATVPSLLKVMVVLTIAFGRIGYLSYRWQREIKMA